MIKIGKDNNIKVVTKGAYESFYKRLGYKPLDSKTVKESNNRNDKKETPKGTDKKDEETPKGTDKKDEETPKGTNE